MRHSDCADCEEPMAAPWCSAGAFCEIMACRAGLDSPKPAAIRKPPTNARNGV